jgi:lysophospholipase L1-like esterase
MPTASTVGTRLTAIELVAMAASYFARAETAEPQIRRGRVGQWCDGVAAIRSRRLAFADYWQTHNHRSLPKTGPLWVALGDSTAQGLGASHPLAGYVGQTQIELRRRTGLSWRVINLSRCGALTQDVLREQLPYLTELPTVPDLLTCGVGANDILHNPPSRVHAALRALIDTLPDKTVILDLPMPTGLWGISGRIAAPYITRVNHTIHAAARERGLPVAELSTHFTSPWTGKFAADRFHPSNIGYRDWTHALLNAIPHLD